MSYNQQQQGGYVQYDPYEQRNPYAQQGYSAANTMEQGNGSGYEMSSYGQVGDPTVILKECKDLGDAIDGLKGKRAQLSAAQKALLDSSTGKEDQSTRQAVDYIEDEINNEFRALRDRLQRIKQTPGSGDAMVQPQISLISRKLRTEIQGYQKVQSEFQRSLREQVRRRYEIANPNLPPEELERGVENVLLGQEQSFQISGSRTRQANDARQAALERSAAIRKIEQDMIELSRLYQEVGELVQQQEPAVEQINQGANDVVDNVQNANKQIGTAIDSARRARRWKWYALIIIILIIVIVVGVAVGVVEANKKS